MTSEKDDYYVVMNEQNRLITWYLKYIGIPIGILIVVLFTLAALHMANLLMHERCRHCRDSHECIKADTMLDTKPAEMIAQTMLTNIESDFRVFAPVAMSFASCALIRDSLRILIALWKDDVIPEL